ncbi:MAG TPA: hypothetical protein VF765_17755 [Polyangiaceae bacterium]
MASTVVPGASNGVPPSFVALGSRPPPASSVLPGAPTRSVRPQAKRTEATSAQTAGRVHIAHCSFKARAMLAVSTRTLTTARVVDQQRAMPPGPLACALFREMRAHLS